MPADPDRLPRVQVVFDPADTRHLVEAVSSLADLAAGRAVCHAMPVGPSLYGLGVAMLLAVGKRFDAAQVERVPSRCWRLAEIWLAAEQIRELFILRAHILGARQWRVLLQLAATRQISLWLVVHRPGLRPPQQAVLAETPATTLGAAEFLIQWADTRPADRSGDADEFPLVPGDDFPTFRAACRRLLDPPSFTRVDTIYREAFSAARSWVRAQTGNWQDRYSVIDAEAVGGFVRDVTAPSASPAETLVRLRGVQAGLFLHGMLVTIDLRSTAMIGVTELRPTLSAAVADRLRGYCTPWWTAEAALMLLAEPPPGALSRMLIHDVDPDGAWVMIDGQRIAIPAYARSLVLAQRIDRSEQLDTRGEPTVATQPLFADRQSVSLRPNRALGRLGAEPRPMGEHGWGLGRAWLARRGLWVSRIDDPYPWALGIP
jgi:hypothetical protein